MPECISCTQFTHTHLFLQPRGDTSAKDTTDFCLLLLGVCGRPTEVREGFAGKKNGLCVRCSALLLVMVPHHSLGLQKCDRRVNAVCPCCSLLEAGGWGLAVAMRAPNIAQHQP